MVTSKKSTTTRRKAGGPRTGEVVLLTCSPLVSEEIMKQLANVCLGKIGEDADGYQRVIRVRVDVSSHIIYAKLEPTIESAYIFAPAYLFAEEKKKPAHELKVNLHLRVENNTKYIQLLFDSC